MPRTLDPLPSAYYYFFWLVEPSLTLAGAFVAIFRPEQYAADLLPEWIERVTRIMGQTTRGQIVIGGLGSCFFLLAMISLSLLYVIKHHVPLSAMQEKLVRGLLIPLAIADLSHITLTLLPLPMSHLKSPSQWTYVMHGNVVLTVGLFLVRMAYFLGIGRSIPSPVAASEPVAVEKLAPRLDLIEESDDTALSSKVRAESVVSTVPASEDGTVGAASPRPARKRRGRKQAGSEDE